MNWYPRLPFGEGPRYLQIVAALHNDIATGLVAAGQQLPTHREMALKLDPRSALPQGTLIGIAANEEKAAGQRQAMPRLCTASLNCCSNKALSRCQPCPSGLRSESTIVGCSVPQ